MQEAARPEKTIPRVEGSHEQDWVRACKAGKKAGADFEYSGPLTEICLLGNVAKRLDTRIDWDAANLRVTNNPEAERLSADPTARAGRSSAGETNERPSRLEAPRIRK